VQLKFGKQTWEQDWIRTAGTGYQIKELCCRLCL
jgi:hypothetical protein